MNDPHVVTLVHRVKHDASVKYDKAKPLEHDTPAFTVRVCDGRARFEMKAHFATAEAAREAVEPFIRAWEVIAALDRGPGEFELAFENVEIVDRKPIAGALHVESGTILLLGSSVSFVVGRGRYPDPPRGITVNADVEDMLRRYARFRDARDELADMAYFCLTVLEDNAGGRAAAATKFKVAQKVLSTLGRLTDQKGGTGARKGKGRRQDFTAAESKWLDEAVKKLIRRSAEVAHDPAQNPAQITIGNLPSLK